MKLVLFLALALAACGSATTPVRLTEDWPAAKTPLDYDEITRNWTRTGTIRGEYQEVLDLAVTFKSPEWRAAHAARDADHRGLTGVERDQVMAQAQAEMAGPYEVELMVTTWDRRENDLDRGKKSVWRVVLVDEQGKEIEPIEIVKDRRPTFTLRAEYPALGDFAIGYIARFPRQNPPLLGPNARLLRLRISGERGGVEVYWRSPG
jgi:hypothetical protein